MPAAPSQIPPAVNPSFCSPPLASGQVSYAVRFRNGSRLQQGGGTPHFTLCVDDSAHLNRLLQANRYQAARTFLEGRYDIEGDLIEAVRFKQARQLRGERLLGWLAMLDPQRWIQSRRRAARDIRFHYDRSNAFYQLFLDAQLVYSCAYFDTPQRSLEEAQQAKLDLICRKLNLQAGESFLDIGCGWGALILHAVRAYGAHAEGCTLSPSQQRYATERIGREAPRLPVRVHLQDYRGLRGRYARIASVGMFEHVGRRRLPGYFRKVHSLLEDGGLFLNHGIIRPQHVRDDAETRYLQQEVFPGGELTSLPEVTRIAEEAGFEVLDVENLRPHYALTCRAWVERLQAHAAACRAIVDERTYRTWLLYLAGSAVSFDSGNTDIHQILLAKRGSRPRRPLNRAVLYGGFPGSPSPAAQGE